MILQFLKKLLGLPVTLYGVWIPTTGWLRVGDHLYADVDKDNVAAVAKRFGGRAEIVDDILKELQKTLLDREAAGL